MAGEDYTAFSQRMLENAFSEAMRLHHCLDESRRHVAALEVRLSGIAELLDHLPDGNNWSVREVHMFRRATELAR